MKKSVKIEKVEIKAIFTDGFSYTLCRDFTGYQPTYKVWVYSKYSHTGKEFTVTKGQFFKKLENLSKSNAIEHFDICTDTGFCMIYPKTGRIYYEKYDFPKF